MRQIRFIAGLLALFMIVPAVVRAQTVVPFQWQGSINQNWGEAGNWTSTIGSFIPDGQFENSAIISNGGTVNVSAPFNDATRTSTGVGGPGNLQVTTGLLQIQNGGELQLFAPSGGAVTRTVQIGGASTIGTLNLQGNGHLDAATLTMNAAGVLDIDFTAATNNSITLSGAATLNGTLNLDFTANPATGSRTLITAPSFSGNFSNVVSTGLGNAVKVAVSRTGTTLLANVVNVPTLTIDRDSGKATLTNTHGTPVSLDGFAVRSAAGGLHPANFAGVGIAGWTTPASNSTTAAGQVFEGNGSVSTSSLSAGFTRQLGNNGFFTSPAPQFFNQPTEDLVFEFTDPSSGVNPVQGVVNYTGKKVVNNTIALYINPSGNAALQNVSPFPQEVEAYRIKSTSGLAANALQKNTWSSLDSQNTDDGTWSVSALSGATQLLELQEGLTGQAGTTTFDLAHIYSIGKILNSGFTQQGFSFEFLLAGQQAFTLGEVVFDILPTLSSADFNGSGKVDAADYTVWRDHLGLTGGATLSQGDANGDGNVTTADYTIWKSHFGLPAGSGAALSTDSNVPEPSSIFLIGVGLLLGMSRVPRRAINRI